MTDNQSTSVTVWLARAIEMFDADTHTDGDLLSHVWLKHALDVPKPRRLDEVDELQWLLLGRLDAFRDYLLVERKTALQSVRGHGYRIVPPAEQARVAVEEAMRLVKRGLEKGDRLMTHTRTEELSVEESRRHTDAHIRLSGIGAMLKKQKRDVFRLFAPSS